MFVAARFSFFSEIVSEDRFDFAYPLRPVQAWLHTAEGACLTPDAQGDGLPADEWFFEFTLS